VLHLRNLLGILHLRRCSKVCEHVGRDFVHPVGSVAVRVGLACFVLLAGDVVVGAVGPTEQAVKLRTIVFVPDLVPWLRGVHTGRDVEARHAAHHPGRGHWHAEAAELSILRRCSSAWADLAALVWRGACWLKLMQQIRGGRSRVVSGYQVGSTPLRHVLQI